MHNLRFFLGALLVAVVAIVAFVLALTLPDPARIIALSIAVVAVAGAAGFLGIGMKAARRE